MYATLTIPALKTLMNEMNDRLNDSFMVPSKARKAEIIDAIEAEISRLWDQAIAENRTRVTRKIAEGYHKSVRPVASLMARAEILAGKVNAYMRQNGTDKLTPAQWRRVRKAMAKHAVTHFDMGQFYVYPW